jgi:hypothetical protein
MIELMKSLDDEYLSKNLIFDFMDLCYLLSPNFIEVFDCVIISNELLTMSLRRK